MARGFNAPSGYFHSYRESTAMNAWFGPVPWGRCCDELPRVKAPLGQHCLHCDEPIAEFDCGQMMPCIPDGGLRPVHRECLIRMVVGSVGHQMGRCSCFGGTEDDPPGMSKRQAAIQAFQYFNL